MKESLNTRESNQKELISFSKPVIDVQATGNQIKFFRKKSGFSVRDIQDIFGFEYPQAVYAWEQGKNVPTIDNLLVLSQLFGVTMDEMVVTRIVEVEIRCAADKAQKLCSKKCDGCRWKLSA
ncbi:MAG: helix-turn-helix domain-containing protein [Treponema sp.]|nr:helix-turn-helix domain-containing protein [Treponema sp.]